MSTFDPNDERITAYILGDDSLSHEDRSAVAELLENNPEARGFAEELRAAASLASAELAVESIPALAPTANIETAIRRELANVDNGVACPSRRRGHDEATDMPALTLGHATPDELAKPKERKFLQRAAWLVAMTLVLGVSIPFWMPAVQQARESARTEATKKVAPSAAPGGFASVFGKAAWDAWYQETPATRAGEGRGAGGLDQKEAAPTKDAAAYNFQPMELGFRESAGAAPGADRGRANDDLGVVKESLEYRTPVPAANGPAGKPATTRFGLEGGEAAQRKPTENERHLHLFAEAEKKADRFDAMGRDGAALGGLAKDDRSKVATQTVPALQPADRPLARLETEGQPAPAPGKANLNVLTDEMVLGELDVTRKEESKLAKNLADQQSAWAETSKARSFALNRRDYNREAYPVLKENDFLGVKENPLSTFSIDVDTASYSIVRRFLNQNSLPPPGAVRLEEIVNYFRYNYQTPIGDAPFAANLEIAECPWNPEHRLARIALKGREIDRNKRPPSNLVFLVDISGSMDQPNKLPLVKESLRLLVNELGENDRVAIAVYASGSGLVLDSTNGGKKAEILYAIDSLRPGGSTNGAAGITCAYEAAVKGFIRGGVNRVLLMTDGDFNVGVTSDDELVKLITEKAKTGVFLSCLAVGDGNLQDKKMMELSNKGNGNYGYLDSIKEAQKILVEQMSGTLVTIAKDVKIQVEFNPAKVSAYRLLGYEKRMLKAEDFKDDKKDAGEIGAGHTITALYELVPAGKTSPAAKVDPLVFQKPAEPVKVSEELSNAMCLVKLRYKQPDGDKSTETSFPASDEGKKYTKASEDFRFAAAAASFAMILRDSPYKGNATLASVHELAAASKGDDQHGYRAEFIKLIEKAKELKK